MVFLRSERPDAHNQHGGAEFAQREIMREQLVFHLSPATYLVPQERLIAGAFWLQPQVLLLGFHGGLVVLQLRLPKQVESLLGFLLEVRELVSQQLRQGYSAVKFVAQDVLESM